MAFTPAQFNGVAKRIDKSQITVIKKGLHYLTAISLLTGLIVATQTFNPPVSANANAVCNQTATTTGTGSIATALDNGYCYVAFKNTGAVNSQTTFSWTRPTGVSAADVLVVGGGGGGGSRHGGGGGAGAFVQADGFSIASASTVAVVVGAGGAGATESNFVGTVGQNSSFRSGSFGLTALGGGFGANAASSGSGGSGGGSGWQQGLGTVTTQSQTTFANAALNGITFGSSGNSGAKEDDGQNDYWAGGGGGGAGGAGAKPTLNGNATENFGTGTRNNSIGGAGGSGRSLSWLSTSVATSLGVGQISGSSVFFAGGGGGGMGVDGAGGGPGGVGGGATGSRYEETPNAGTANTGGGGGGSGFDDISPARANRPNAPGGAGGSGVVVLRYLIPPNAPTINTVTSGTASLSVAFTAPTSNGSTVTGYEYSINGGSNWISAGTTSPFIISGLTNGTTYTVTLRALNGSSVSPASSGVTGTPLPTCSPSSSNSNGIVTATFTNASACNWVVPAGVTSVEAVVVAGGGGGGFNYNGGGGGAGEVLVSGSANLVSGTVTNISGTTVTPGSLIRISIGAGGSSGAPTGSTELQAQTSYSQNSSSSTPGGAGGDSSFGSIIAKGGGGGGGGGTSVILNGGTGGSGGGGASGGTGGSVGGNVYSGWTSFKNIGSGGGSGGGGGAGSAGDSVNGGSGITVFGKRVAGGGGGWGGLGGARSLTDTVLGGNGRLTVDNWRYAGTAPNYTSNGVATTGTGGGAGAFGGSGVVIVRYANSPRSVTYSLNSGTGTTPTQNAVSDGGSFTVASDSGFSRAGHIFRGWTDGTTTYQSGASYAVGANNITLTAVWQSLNQRLSYNLSDINSYDSTVNTTVTDLSGSNRNGTLTGSGTSIGTNGAMVFPGGVSSSGPFIDVPDIPTTGFNTNGITIDFEANFGNIDIWERIIDFGVTGERTSNLLVGRIGNETNVGVEIYNGITSLGVCKTGILTGLIRYTIVLDGTNCHIHRTGQATYTTAFTVKPVANQTWTSNFIGKSNWSADASFAGELRSVRIFEGAFTPEEIGAFNYKTVTFDTSNGGTATPTSKTTSGAIKLASLSRTGFISNGWFTASSGGSKIGDAGASYTPTSDVTLFSQWTANLSITTPSSGLSGTVGTPYSLTLSSAGGSGGNDFTVTSGSLPAGLSLNSATGVISGTPTTVGSSSAVVTVTDSGNRTAATSSFTITISAATLSNAGTPTVSATSATLKSIDVSWSAVANASSYTIRIYASNGTTLRQTLTGLTGTSKTITASDFAAIADNTIYQISLTAIGTGNYATSSESSKASVTTNATYTVTYNYNEATGGNSTASNSFIPGQAGITLPVPTRTHFTFDGWFDNAGFLGNAYTSPFSPTASITLFAKWTVNTFNITLNKGSNGTGSDRTLVKTATETLTLPNSTTANSYFTRTGFIVSGWSTTDGGAQTHALGGAFDTNATTTLYPVWTGTLAITTPSSGLTGTFGTSYTLTVSASGGSGGNNFTISSGSLPAGLSLNSATGVISGTPTTAGSSSVVIRVTDSNSSTASTSSFTITIGASALSNAATPTVAATTNTLKSIAASWTAVTNASSYTLRIYAADGTTLLQTLTGLSGTSRTITTSDYSSLADNTTYQISLTAVGTGNYATSSESGKASVTTNQSFTVTYDYNNATGGNSTASNLFVVGGTAITLPVPSRTNHTFGGWFEAQDLSGSALGSTYSPTQSRTIYAKWTINSVTVTYNSNGGSPVTSGTVNVGANLARPQDPTRAGHYFLGWSATSGGPTVTFPYAHGQTSNFTLFAIWTKAVHSTGLRINLDATNRDSLGSGSTVWRSIAPGRTDVQSTSFERITFSPSSTPGSVDFTSSTSSLRYSSAALNGAASIPGSSAVTAEAWIKLPANYQPSTTAQRIATFWFDSSTGNTTTESKDWWFEIESGRLRLYMANNSAGEGWARSGEIITASLADQWIHVGFTLLSDGKVQFYLNGLVASSLLQARARDANRTVTTAQLIFGSGVSSLVGSMSKFRLYEGALTADQIRSNFNAEASEFSRKLARTISIDAGSYNSNYTITATPPTITSTASAGGGTKSFSSTTTGVCTINSSGVVTFVSAGTCTLTSTIAEDNDYVAVTSSSISFTVSLNSALNPTFGTPTRTVDGFTVQISNYDNAYTWAGTATASGIVSIGATGLVTVTGVAANTSSTLTVTTTRTGYTGGSGTASATSLPRLTITFNINDGSGTTTTQSVNSATATSLTANSFTRTGFTFVEWTTAADGSGTAYANSASITTSADVTLYAQWTKIKTTNLVINLDATDPQSLGTNSIVWNAVRPGTSTSSQTGQGNVAYSDSGGVKSLTFDGNQDFFDYTAVADSRVTGAMSFEMWIKPGSLRAGWNILATRWFSSQAGAQGPTSFDWHFAIYPLNGQLKLNLYATNQATSWDKYGSHVFTANSPWVLVGFTLDNSGNLKFYVNGKQDGATITGISRTNQPDSRFFIGDPRLNVGFPGGISKARLYNTDLSAAEMLANFDADYEYYGLRKITFNENIGAGSSTTTQYVSNNTATALSANSFIRSGYTFAGWATTSGGSVAFANSANITATSDTILYAVWTVAAFTVTYDYNNATGGNTTATSTFTVGGTAITLPIPTRTGFTFGGWYEASNLSGSALGSTYSPTQSRTIYAKWTADVYTITYNYNSATGGNSTATSSFTFGGTAITLPIPTRTGFTFAGWYEAQDLSGSALGSTYSPTQSRTIYAKWTANSLTLTFHKNDNSGTTSTQSITAATSTALTSNSFTRTGYTFAGWSANSNGTGTQYTNGESVTLLVATNFYAKWTANTLTVTFHRNDGSGNTATQSITAGTATALTTNAFTRTGYTFSGWSANSDGTGTSYGDGESVTIFSNLPLYAKWTAISYTVAYNTNGATGSAPTQANRTIGQTFTVAAATGLTRTGYTFGGWSDGTTTFQPNATFTLSSSNVTLIAQWNVDTYTITYSANNGTGSAARTTDSYIFGSAAIVLPGRGSLARAGYSFAGWSETSGGSAISGSYTPTQTRTLFAVWSPNTYTITYNSNGATGSPSVASESYTTGNAGSNLASQGTMTKLGHDFAGWATSAGATAQQIVSTPFTTTSSLTLYAVWSPIGYTVDFNLAGGNSSPPTESAKNFNQTFTLPAAATRAPNSSPAFSWAFVAWCSSAVVNGLCPDADQYQAGSTFRMGTANIEFTAVWIRVFTVKYTMNGASTAAPADVFSSDGASVTLANAPVRAGYSFTGWRDQSGQTYTAGATMVVDLDSYLVYAQWSPINYAISYLLNGGTSAQPAGATRNIGDVVTVAAAPTRAGFRFNGWSYNSQLYGAGASVIVGITDITFSASWSAIDYNVTYDMNGSTTTRPTVSSKRIGQTFALAAAPSRAGYTFAGWSDGAETKNAGATYTVGSSDITLTATWTAVNYTLTYDVNGGNSQAPNGAANLNISNTFTVAAAPTHQNRTFLGWSDGTNTYTAGQTYTVGSSNVTLSAMWSGVNYNIVYDLNGGSGTAPTESAKEAGQSITVKSDNGFARPNYTFAGWKNGNQAISPNDSLSVGNSDVTLVAQWTPAFTVSFNANGGSATSNLTFTGTALARPTNPTRANFVFEGWTDNGNDVSWPLTPTGPVNLQARWTQLSLYGLNPSDLARFGQLTARTGVAASFTGSNTDSSVAVNVPAGSLPEGTTINIDLVGNTARAQALIPATNSYLVSFVVSWLATDGTVPLTAANKPISMTITNAQIKAGAVIYSVIGDSYTILGRANQDGTVTIQITEDPEILVAATKPDAPTNVTGTSTAATNLTASWSAPAINGGATITGYTATTNTGQSCTTSTLSCTINGLTAATSYTVTVIATNSIGNSVLSSPSAQITTAAAQNNGGGNQGGGNQGGGNQGGGNQGGGSGGSNQGGGSGGSGNSGGGSTPIKETPAKPVLQTGDGKPVVPASGGGKRIVDGVIKTELVRVIEKQIVRTEFSSVAIEVKAVANNNTVKDLKENTTLVFEQAGKASLTGSGFKPVTKVKVWIFSEPTYLGEAEVKSDGSFDAALLIPANFPAGNHTLQINGVTNSNEIVTQTFGVVVEAKPTAPKPETPKAVKRLVLNLALASTQSTPIKAQLAKTTRLASSVVPGAVITCKSFVTNKPATKAQIAQASRIASALCAPLVKNSEVKVKFNRTAPKNAASLPKAKTKPVRVQVLVKAIPN